MEAEPTRGFWMVSMLILGVLGLIAVGGIFGLIYWMMGRGKDDEAPD